MTVLLTMILLSTASVAAQESSESRTPGENTSVTYTGKIQPLFLEKCAGCHGEAAPEHKQAKKDKEGYKARELGPRMDTYTYLKSFIAWPDTGAVPSADSVAGSISNAPRSAKSLVTQTLS